MDIRGADGECIYDATNPLTGENMGGGEKGYSARARTNIVL